MYSALSNQIRVTVEPTFLAEQSDPAEDRYFWAYTIEITNCGDKTVQLTHRQWKIVDANGRREEVQGLGVVGKQPTLKPGEAFRYTSGCPLTTPSGMMVGSYRMVDENGQVFEVEIPPFSLDSPYSKHVAN